MMNHWRTYVVFFIFLFCSSSLYAKGKPPQWNKNWRCAKEIPILKSTINYLKSKQLLHAYRLKGKALPLLISEDYAGSGLILYTRLQGRWRAYPIANASINMGVYSTAAHFRVAIFSMSRYHQLTMLNIKNKLRHLSCNILPLPKEIKNKNTQFLTVQDFNVLPTGNGQLLGAAYDFAKSEPSKLRWFRYHTHNWGYRWDKPGPIRAPKKGKKLPGSFIRAKMFPAPKWLSNSLLKQAR